MIPTHRRTWTALALFFILTAKSAAISNAADLRLAPAFSDDMVLQRDKPVVVWGEADPNATVEVSIGGGGGGNASPDADRQTATADADGRWKVSLKPRPASRAPTTLRAASGGREAVARNVLVGDVWLCAGQSNMQMGVREADGGEDAVKGAAEQVNLRLLAVPKRPAAKPQTRFDARWRTSSAESVANFPAVGYHFARQLTSNPAMADLPIGLVDCSFGGTAAEAWLSPAGLESIPPADRLGSMFGGPGQQYNGMIAPLAPFPARGVLWYQGESNGARPDVYPKVLSTMIADWRNRWADPTLPFLVVQLPPFVDPKFTWVREAQSTVVRSTPNAALAVTIDTTDGFDLHPKQKREIGVRLALLARRDVYKQRVVASGPTFKEARVDGPTMRVTFDTGGDGLAAGSAGTVRGFAVAGEEGAYRFATARIDGDAVVLTCPEVPAPRTVRYAWAGIPVATLTNRSGLPAAPFRTDDLPRSTLEVQARPVSHRLATDAYEVEVNGDGKVTSLAVRGKQFLSNAVGGAGGTSIPHFFGPRSLPDVRAVGPDLLSCGDNDLTLSLAFKPDGMDWSLANRGKDGVQFRVALAAGVSVGAFKAGAPVTLTRGKATLTVAGVDSIADGEDGKMLQVAVKGGATKRLTLTVGGK